MASVKYICEFGTIWNAGEFAGQTIEDSYNTIFLDKRSFESLKNFVAENNDPDLEVEQAFSVHRKKGKDFIRVKNFVGVVETKQGTVIEILPKIYQSSENESEQIGQSKKILLKMLRSLKNTPFKSIDQAHLKASRMPILEIFISVFLNEMETMVKRGIKSYYKTLDENQNYLKGRLLFSENIRKNLIHKERFYVQHDVFQPNIPQNRILKSALVYLKSKSRSTPNITQIINLLYLFDEVDECKNIEKDLLILDESNRLFSHYSTALKWARVFLLNKSFTSYKGHYLNTAILFPMETLFESYVAHRVKQGLPELEVSTQDRKHHLVFDIGLNQNKFRLRPDIVVQTNNVLVVADTKWKIINQNQISKNYLISQTDLYQLFAYGKKYESNTSQIRLLLIYPRHHDFFKELSFDYGNHLQLIVYPFDFSNEEQLTKRISNIFESEIEAATTSHTTI